MGIWLVPLQSRSVQLACVMGAAGLILSGCAVTGIELAIKPAEEICLQALTPIDHPLGWKADEQSRTVVAEAKRRGYTTDSCARSVDRPAPQKGKDDAENIKDPAPEPRTESGILRFQKNLDRWLKMQRK